MHEIMTRKLTRYSCVSTLLLQRVASLVSDFALELEQLVIIQTQAVTNQFYK